jgi:hypothetical protein
MVIDHNSINEAGHLLHGEEQRMLATGIDKGEEQ